MNDFTKEELQHLHDAVREYDCTDWQDDLAEKLQSMIDNYCEHEKMEFDGDVYGYSCKKCEEQFTGQTVDADRHYKIIRGGEG